MDLSLTLRFRSPELSLLPGKSICPVNFPRKQYQPIVPRPNTNPETTPYTLKPRVLVTVKKRSPLEGVSQELNEIASKNLDFAPSRRRVRSAFLEAQQHLDHFLFKGLILCRCFLLNSIGVAWWEDGSYWDKNRGGKQCFLSETVANSYFLAMESQNVKKKVHSHNLNWYERNSKGLEIFCKNWMPQPGVRIKGALFFCHGYGDTCTFFFEGIAKQIAASGYAVYALDHPSFGLSEGLHGYISSFDELVDNVIENYKKIKGRPELKGLPRFLLGQSMGGAVALKVHLKEPLGWDGVILVAPMCKKPTISCLQVLFLWVSAIFGEEEWWLSISDVEREVGTETRLYAGHQVSTFESVVVVKIAEDVKPPAPVLKALILMAKVMPKAKLFPQKDLSELAFRDPWKRKIAAYNVICYNDQTRLKTAVELLKVTSEIEKQVDKVSSPLLILHGAADKVTDPLVSQFLYEKASTKDKTLKFYEGGYHCMLEGEPDERIVTVLEDIVAWLDCRCSLN
ncbi:Caffeoylshikimate esterase [Morella rubra]|uniref:Caffeoylshikimate esterase n=1 Tax=Morella rubra TaxID=262757 RepID=A0A6A1W714_9ROSI|nr:Caffeoylshikimate esterase [Morella rubra]